MAAQLAKWVSVEYGSDQNFVLDVENPSVLAGRLLQRLWMENETVHSLSSDFGIIQFITKKLEGFNGSMMPEFEEESGSDDFWVRSSESDW